LEPRALSVAVDDALSVEEGSAIAGEIPQAGFIWSRQWWIALLIVLAVIAVAALLTSGRLRAGGRRR
jgi:hypothetical protein